MTSRFTEEGFRKPHSGNRPMQFSPAQLDEFRQVLLTLPAEIDASYFLGRCEAKQAKLLLDRGTDAYYTDEWHQHERTKAVLDQLIRTFPPDGKTIRG